MAHFGGQDQKKSLAYYKMDLKRIQKLGIRSLLYTNLTGGMSGEFERRIPSMT